MNNDEILERAKAQEPELAEGDLVLLLNAEAKGCADGAFVVAADGGSEELDVIPFDLEDGFGVECCRNGDTLLSFETVNNRVKEVDTTEEVKLDYLNVGRRGVVFEGGAVRPGAGGSLVPVDVGAAMRACGMLS